MQFIAKLYGDDAKRIDGEITYKIVKYTRKTDGVLVAELVPTYYFCSVCGEWLKEIDLGHDDTDLMCLNEACSEYQKL